MKALVKVGYACNENCTFCHTAELRHLDDSSARVLWKIERARELGHNMVVFSGGEPTIRPELLAWCRRAAALGLDTGLVTNGLMLSYPDVTRELVEDCRLRYVYLSLHGGDAKTHRSVVRADTFERALAAIEELHARDVELTVNCVVTTANEDALVPLVERLAGLPKLTVKLSMVQPKGGADRAFDVIVPRVTDAAARVKEAIERGLALRAARGQPGPDYVHDGLPLCLLPGLEDRVSDLRTHRFATMIEADEDDFVPVDDIAKVHPPACDGCALRGPCGGLYRGYFEARGDAELRPRAGVRSNSFHYVPERDVARAPGAPCPILKGGTSPYDRARTVFVRLRDRMRLYRTWTRDFSDEELLAIKEARGQLYADVSTKAAPDDFAKDLRKLTPSRECTACEARPRCTGAWVASEEPVFQAIEARLFAELDALGGRVLDVGAGDGPYLARLAPRAARGEIDLVAIDPDAERLGLLGARFPFVHRVTGAAEELATREEIGRVDHALVLGSYNHLEDPRAALVAIASRLREGGTLLVADDVAFGLVRGQELARRAERHRRFEHARNDDAEAAARCLEGLPFRIASRLDAGPETSTRWMIRAVRTA